jgi:hypothetical protein
MGKTYEKPASTSDAGPDVLPKGGLTAPVVTNRGYPGGRNLENLIGAEKVSVGNSKK